ncbi:MAG: hypothetical protein IT379_21670 [Deltaproteobacteria bacterium]|nr:hypothetical protein [Deltaproteobacteria bacterium]
MESWMPLVLTAILVAAALVLAIYAVRSVRRGRSKASDLVSISLGGAAAVDSVPPPPARMKREEGEVAP